MKSYVNVPLQGFRRVRELLALYWFRRATMADEANQLVKGVREHSQRIEALLDEPLHGKRILEVGPGQLLKRARIFGVSSSVVGIDLDEVPGGGLSGFIGVWRANGPLRALKTLARRMLGMDRHFLRSLYAILPEAQQAHVDFVRCDATRTGFSDAEFDVTVSNSVLEHIPDPIALTQEMIRITRAGGVYSHIVHLYTSDTGAHDPRSYLENRSDLPYWAHLRPQFQNQSTPNCYLNRWRITDWMSLAEQCLPGATVELIPEQAAPAIERELLTLRANGELPDYSDAELITDCLIISWRKPS